MRNSLLTIVFFIFTQLLFSQEHWESIVLAEDEWQYVELNSEPPSNWYTSSFDASGWHTGKGGFGYADNDDGTITNQANTSVYFRIIFTIDDTSTISRLILDVDYDDAFVAYINDHEVARSANIIDDHPLFNSFISYDHEASLYSGGFPERNELNTSILSKGLNTLAVQIINISKTSSDMTGRVYLHAEISNSSASYKDTPDWFNPPVNIIESNLPVIKINTLGQAILDEPKINVEMGIINNENGMNNINDSFNEYDGMIGIEKRGSSSRSFYKKSYNLETRTDSGTNNNVALLGMPEENDWVLHGPFSDKSLMRNALAYHLGNITGHWAPRARFCEVFINDEYVGVYLLLEKIKRDKNRVDIAKLRPDEIAGDNLTGGYIIKIDREEEGSWVSPFKSQDSNKDIHFGYVDPKYSELAIEQRRYIENFIIDFETALHSSSFKDPVYGYRAFINVPSFVDFYLHSELSKNVDAYRLSTYFNKDKDSKGGKINMGPLWDYNLAFGNANYYEAGFTDGWIPYTFNADDNFQIPFWWERLREDSYFNILLKRRWSELRNDKFSIENINHFIDSTAKLLATAQQRNFQKLPILGKYIWPNNYIGGSFENEIIYLKNWISERLTWLDAQIGLIKEIEIPEELVPIAGSFDQYIYTYPNPFSESVTLTMNLPQGAHVSVRVTDIAGKTIYSENSDFSMGTNEVTIDSRHFGSGPGLYLYHVMIDGNKARSGKLIRVE